MIRFFAISTFVLSLGTAAVQAQNPVSREPHIGYAYPAGGRVGTKSRVVLGGQYIRSASDVEVSGDGVTAKIVKKLGNTTKFKSEQRDMLVEKFRALWKKRLDELSPADRKKLEAFAKRYNMYLRKRRKPASKSKAKSKDTKPNPNPNAKPTAKKVKRKYKPKFPENPFLVGMEDADARELLNILSVLVDFQSRWQKNRQLAEAVVLEVEIAPDAALGDREIRLKTKGGVWTNPVVFQVGTYPETKELEPNSNQYQMDGLAFLDGSPPAAPVVFNGQIFPGDVDRLRFRAKKGGRLVVRVASRRLVPYLADAVPGWCQAVVSVLDSKGKELAYADDYRFDPDPVLFFEVPKDGTYQIEIRDAIYRGREDFVYRVSVAESPFVTSVFPLGGRAGTAASAEIAGWNLPVHSVSFDTSPGGGWIRKTSVVGSDGALSNVVKYAVDDLPEMVEDDSANDAPGAEKVALPVIVNGRIDRPKDRDRFSFHGAKGGKVAFEVAARRLGSPLDSLVKLYGPDGELLAWNDDHSIKRGFLHKNPEGLLTHHADSYLLAELPEDGEYVVQISDAQSHGGKAFAYRLRISRPKPDFDLMVSPSSVHLRPGGSAPLTLRLIRRDGFDGEVRLAFSGAKGFSLVPSVIPAGTDDIGVVLTAGPKVPGNRDFHPSISGVAKLDGELSARSAVPADNVMQAFLYRHLVPAADLVVSTMKGKAYFTGARELDLYKSSADGAAAERITLDNPLILMPGGSASVSIKIPKKLAPKLKTIRFVLENPPKGLSCGKVSLEKDFISFVVSADPKAKPMDAVETLIVSTIKEFTPKPKPGKKAKKRVWALGYYFAVPYRISKGESYAEGDSRKN